MHIIAQTLNTAENSVALAGQALSPSALKDGAPSAFWWDKLLVIALLLAAGLLVLALAQVSAASRTVLLTTEQETALLAATEQANERLGCTMASCGDKLDADGKPLVPLTLDATLAQIVGADLANVLRNLDAGIAPVLDNLKALDAATLAKVLATVPSQSTRNRVQQKLAPSP